MDTWVGTRSCPPAAVDKGLLSAYLGYALVVGGVPKSHGEPEARDALWEIKGRSKAAS